MRKLYYLPLCVAVLALTGCKDEGLSADEKEERDPLVKTGVAYMDQSQWDAAERAFKEALDNDPLMAKPHLDLALIYQQYKVDYIHAIYHYDRYLELRPESEKAALIKEQRDKVQRALAVQLMQETPEGRKVIAEIQRLQKENTALKKELAASNQTTQPDRTRTAPSTTEAQPAATTTHKPAAKTQPAAKHQIYTVVSGDTLTKIATKFYGDSESWEPIYEANKDSMSSPSSLRVGQTLVIPSLEN